MVVDKSSSSSTINIDLTQPSNLASGLYLLVIQYKEEITTIKFLKNSFFSKKGLDKL